MKKILMLTCCSLILFIGNSCDNDDDAFLKIDKTKREYTFDATGGNVSVPVNSNYAFDVESSASWCNVTIVNQSFKIAVDKLQDGYNRSAEITVTSKDAETVKIKVTQEAISIKELPSIILLTNKKNEFTIEITSSFPLVFDLPEWLQRKNMEEWTWGTNSYTFVAENYQGAEGLRKDELTVKSEDSKIGYSLIVPIEQTNYTNEAILKLHQLWETSPISVNNTRRNLFGTMQEYADQLLPNVFQSYLVSTETAAVDMEKNNPILSCYRYAFDKVLDRVKNENVEEGTTVVWLLYNMGIIVKTPTGCFGIDVNHRLAEQFAPHLDFLCVTHNHADHKSVELMNAMHNAGKPVLSNFYTASNMYYSTSAANYTIGDVSIRTNITDHDAELKNFTTVYRISCGSRSGDFTILHCGDSSFNPTQYTNVQGGNPSLLMLRNGNKIENNIIGTGAGQVKPSFAFLSHIIELRHQIGSSPKRFPILETLGHVSQINCTTYMPFWGEKLVWKNGVLK